MSRKQLFALFVVNLTGFTVGTGSGTLLPIDAVRLGADPALIGLYLSCIFTAIASGIVVAGWLSDKVQRRKLILIVAGTVSVVSILLTGQAVNVGQLALLSIITSFLGGMQIAMVNTLAGLFAEEADRGRVFGTLASTIALGSLIGGLGAGFIVDRWGFVGLFTMAAGVTLLQPAASLLLEDKEHIPIQRTSKAASSRGVVFSRAILFLFLASIVAFVTNGIHGLGRSLLMNSLGFDTSAISSTLAVSGLVTLPFPLMMGWLSDRIGRKPLLIVSYLASAVSLIALAGSSSLWQFWISTALQAVLAASLGIGAALVTDLVPPEALGSGLSLFSATNWIGLIIGSAFTGAAFQRLGAAPTLIAGTAIALVAVCLVLVVQRPVAKSSVQHFSVPAGQ